MIRRRDNDFYRHGMAVRYVKQIEIEGIHTYKWVENGRWGAERKQLSRGGYRYKMFPQPDNTKIVVSHIGDILLPVDIDTRTELIDHWIKVIPEGDRVGGTHGFGGDHAGSCPPSKAKGRYYRIKHHIEIVKGELYISGIEFREDEHGNVYITEKLEGEGIEFVIAKMSI